MILLGRAKLLDDELTPSRQLEARSLRFYNHNQCTPELQSGINTSGSGSRSSCGQRNAILDDGGFSCFLRRGLIPNTGVHLLHRRSGVVQEEQHKKQEWSIPSIAAGHDNKRSKPSTTVLWLSSHFAPFYDALFVLEKSFPDWTVHKHGLLSYHKRYFPEYQTDDKALYDILGQIHDPETLRTNVKMHEDFEGLETAFLEWVQEKFGDDLDIALCDHPVIWCRFFTQLILDETKSLRHVVGGYDQPHLYAVPESRHEWWTQELRMLAARGDHTFVGYTAFGSVQFQYSLGKLIPYQKAMALRLGANFTTSTEDQDPRAGPGVSGGASSYRGPGAWNPYIEGQFVRSDNLRILEMGSRSGFSNGLSILLRRVLSASGKIDVSAFIGVVLTDPETGEEVADKGIEWLRKEERRLEQASPSPPTRAEKLSLQAQYFDLVILWPYDIFNLKLAEYYALRMPIFVHAELWRYTRRGSHPLLRDDTQPERLERWNRIRNFGKTGNRSCGGGAGETLPGSVLFEVGQDADGQVDAHACSPKGTSSSRSTMDDILDFELHYARSEDEPEYLFSPLETKGRFQLDHWAGFYYGRLSEFALRPHIQYFRSVSHLLEITLDLQEEKELLDVDVDSSARRNTRSPTLVELSKRMDVWYRETSRDSVKFWERLFQTI
ncbi:unnamed protein product [Amoebophrya sp. A25]|nr:unnamed protein product [Amoebophrya sp. A25]|eukprot:GSA25T00025206001.1